MITFLKANIASLAASLSDFLITVLLVQVCRTNVVMAAAAGTVTGGIINFLIGRHWVFQAGDTRRMPNAERRTQNEMHHIKLYFALGVKRLAFSINLEAVRQLWKYALVWAGNLLLNTGGVYVLACQAGWHYTVSKVVTSLLVAFLYNYPLQKNFVFSNNWIEDD
ncbi:GtrA family protein [Niastella caeni]|uniref:GtrA family protein n=1 Tax=Niastella caeni TaxID=2569763 RepID=A0A4S8HIT0_9BACT|nr:GtrA family protein [Niastella caeni]THU34963.1 GtrA family protein [Niastella caeni]